MVQVGEEKIFQQVEGRKYLDVGHPALSDMKPILQLIKDSGE
jgi:hypothetical protein